MTLSDQRIGLIGGGAMAEALLGGVLAAGHAAGRLSFFDPVPARREHLKATLGVTPAESNGALVASSDVVVLAVKPGLVPSLLRGLDPGERELVRPLWISIAAGVSLQAICAAIGEEARVVRAMPNTPALVRCGATAFCAGERATPADRSIARALFETVGLAWEAPAEGLLDAVTGLSGSGPAYVFLFLEALADAGVRMGLPRDAAHALACQTVLGAATLAQTSGRHPAQLKDQVTSPGGTTIAGVERLEALGLRAAVHAAVEAATARSKELGRG